MKKFVLILSAILLISLLVVSFAQENYEPVSVKEKELLNKGYEVVEFNDTPYDQRPIYFKDGMVATKTTIKRVVQFKKVPPDVKSLGAGYGGWSMEINENIKLTLFYVIRTMKVPVTQSMTKEVKVPVSLETKVDTTKVETKTPIGKETK
jgi:hypothetical protein